MSQTLRHPEILEMVRRDGKVMVEGLAAHFGVTLQTIRRDLTDLSEAGRLDRVHGGAVLPSGTSNIGYEERRALNSEAIPSAVLPSGKPYRLTLGKATDIPFDTAKRMAKIARMEALAGNDPRPMHKSGELLKRAKI